MLGNRTALPVAALALAISSAAAAALEPKPVNDASFEADIIQPSRQTPVAVVFVAAWCGPCRVITPAVWDLATQYEGRVTFATLDVDQSSSAPMTYGVSSLPTTVLFKGGQVVDKKLGAMSKDILEKWIAPHAR